MSDYGVYTLGLWASVFVWVLHRISKEWLAVIRAYLEATAKAAGAEMHVAEDDGGEPGHLYPPTVGAQRPDWDEV